MSWPASTIVDAVFIPIYIGLAFLSLFNVIFHGAGKTFGFIYLLVFSLARLIANILLVYSYNTHYRNGDVLEWGFILQGLGYSFLISATLAFFSRAQGDDGGNNTALRNVFPMSNIQEGATVKKLTLGRVLHLANLLALILLITGYTDSENLFPTSMGGSASTGQLDVKARIGDIIFLVLTVVVGLLSIIHFRSALPHTEPRILLSFVLAALVPMLIRVAYVSYQSFTKHPLQRNLAVKVVLEYVMEVIAVSIYGLMGVLLRRFINDQPDIEIRAISHKSDDA